MIGNLLIWDFIPLYLKLKANRGSSPKKPVGLSPSLKHKIDSPHHVEEEVTAPAQLALDKETTHLKQLNQMFSSVKTDLKAQTLLIFWEWDRTEQIGSRQNLKNICRFQGFLS